LPKAVASRRPLAHHRWPRTPPPAPAQGPSGAFAMADADGKEKAAPPIWLKVVHLLVLFFFFTNHIGLMRHHMVTVSSLWSFVMVTCEMMVLVMHALGLSKSALLISCGEMAGGHFQHCFTNGQPFIEGLLSTFPGMNIYLLSASISYFTAPWTVPANRPSLKKWLSALGIGILATVGLMISTQVAQAELLILLPGAYLFLADAAVVRESVMNFLTSE